MDPEEAATEHVGMQSMGQAENRQQQESTPLVIVQSVLAGLTVKQVGVDLEVRSSASFWINDLLSVHCVSAGLTADRWAWT